MANGCEGAGGGVVVAVLAGVEDEREGGQGRVGDGGGDGPAWTPQALRNWHSKLKLADNRTHTPGPD
jgi:hypothetical protein